jgi:phytoene/squalene synthetase
MSTVREAWTDERLDDLQGEMRRGFDRVDTDLRELRVEMNARFNAVDARFDAMQRTMVIGFASIAAGVFASTAATVLG